MALQRCCFLSFTEYSKSFIHFRANNYYGKVTEFFRKNEIIGLADKICFKTFSAISYLWNELEEWSIITKNCELGVFELKQFGNRNWIHVGKPLSQCILPPSAINKLPELFWSVYKVVMVIARCNSAK